jgi:hypothetical protein
MSAKPHRISASTPPPCHQQHALSGVQLRPAATLISVCRALSRTASRTPAATRVLCCVRLGMVCITVGARVDVQSAGLCVDLSECGGVVGSSATHLVLSHVSCRAASWQCNWASTHMRCILGSGGARVSTHKETLRMHTTVLLLLLLLLAARPS